MRHYLNSSGHWRWLYACRIVQYKAAL